MRNEYLRNALQQLAFITSKNYNIDVIIEGNELKVENNKIILPSFEEITPSLYEDLNAFVDGAAAKIRFGTSNYDEKITTRLEKEIYESLEAQRCKLLHQKDYVGAGMNIEALNSKYKKVLEKNWDKLSTPAKILAEIQGIIQGNEFEQDEKTRPYINAVKSNLESAEPKTAKESFELAQALAKSIVKIKEKEEKENNSSGNGNFGNGISEEFKAFEEENSEEKSGKKPNVVPKGINDMLHENIKEEILLTNKKVNLTHGYYRNSSKIESKNQHIPYTTKYDLYTDCTGVGSVEKLANILNKNDVIINRVTQYLDDVLTVIENKRIKHDREEGDGISELSIWKLAINQDYQDIYYSLERQETKDVAVSLVIDLSGSMHGNKISIATVAATLFSEALNRINIKNAVYGFSTKSNHLIRPSGTTERFNRVNEVLDNYVFKSFDQDSILGIMSAQSGGCNCDGESILLFGQELAERREKRKIMIVFSDGQPSIPQTNHTVLANHLKWTVDEMTSKGIEMIGIGIGTDDVKLFYDDWLVVNDIEKLPEVVADKLCMLLRKGMY